MKNDYHESESHKQVRLREAELMREAAAEPQEDEAVCMRCAKFIEARYESDQVCTCPYDDWHEEYPDLELQEGE